MERADRLQHRGAASIFKKDKKIETSEILK